MTWPTHQTGATLAAFSLNLPAIAVMAAFFGAIMPDLADQAISRLAPGKRLRQKVFNKIHRGQSHWFGWWLLLFLLTLALSLPSLARDILCGLAIGSLTHIVMDMLTPRGVPLLPFGQVRNIAIPVCSTGKIGEYIFMAILILLGGFWLFTIDPVKGGLLLRWAH